MTDSEVSRQKGNDFFKKASAIGLSPVIKLDRFQKALAQYHNALNAAINDKQRCSALKNIFISTHYVAKILLERNEIDQSLFYFKECLTYGDNAVSLGTPETMTQEWIDNLELRVETVISDILDIISEMKYERRTRVLYRMSSIPKSQEHQARMLKQLVLDYFHHSVSALSNGDFKTCLTDIYELYTPQSKLEDLNKSCHNNELIDFIVEMQEDAFKTQCIAESMQSRDVADKLLHSTIHDAEQLDLIGVWQCIDFYKESILLTRENDVEQEAISMSRLGKVYHEVLKQKTRAKEMFMLVVHLGSTLQPRNLSQEEWYRYSTTILAEYQLKEQQKEEEEWQNSRQRYLDKMQVKLNELQVKSVMSAQKFLVWLYKTHPPQHTKTFDVNLKEIEKATAEQCNKLLAKAIVFYHPDKIDAKVFGMEYKVFSEEITKYLTSKYECFK